MASFNRFFIFFLLATLAIFIERSGFLNVGGIVPNLLLILCVALIVSHERMGMIVALFSAVLISAFFVDAFWIAEFGILGLIVVLLALVRKRLTGSNVADILIMTLAGEILFYGTLAILHGSMVLFITIAYEFVYTAAIGIPLWLVSRRYL